MNPFTDKASESIGSLGEIELIDRVKFWLGPATQNAPRGVGDDCAVIPLPKNKDSLLITTDPIVYGRHFDDTLSPESAASKLVRRNLSDIAAMGGSPASAVLSLSAPAKLSLVWLERFYQQIAKEAERFGIEISGGDVCSTDSHLGIYATLFGFAGCRILQRKSCQSGDRIYVTGSLGGSRLKKHYDFEPRLREGQWLASKQEVTSCMDISDGLGKDLPMLLPDGVTAFLDGPSIPISDDAATIADISIYSSLYHAINDGEDFELLFTISEDWDHQSFLSQWKSKIGTPVTKIGYLRPQDKGSDSVLIIENASDDVAIRGYEHYRQT